MKTQNSKPEQETKETPEITLTYEKSQGGETKRDPRWVLKINGTEQFFSLKKGDRGSKKAVFTAIADQLKAKHGVELERTSRYQFGIRKPTQEVQVTLAA
jgi:hypothetical protein